MKPIAMVVLAFALTASSAMFAPAFAQGRIDENAERRFAAAYSELFIFIQQERSCCVAVADPLARWELSINQIIAKFKAVKTTGLPQEIVKGWEDLRDKHIAEQEAYRNEIKFIAKVKTETPGYRVNLQQDPRPLLPASRVAEWDAVLAAANRAGSQAATSVTAFDAIWAKYSPPRR